MSAPRLEYEQRIARWSALIAAGERRQLTISNLRLAVAAAAALLLWVIVARWTLSPAWMLVPALSFTALVVWHARVIRDNERAERARRLYERGLARIDGAWIGSGPDGARFGTDHPFAHDLDLFGSGSVFQLYDTARTEIGEETLADWLRAPASASTVVARQEAVRELRPMLDFRESIAVLAAEADVGRTGALATWASGPPVAFPRWSGPFFIACAAVTLALAVACLAGSIEWIWVVVFILAHRSVAYVWRSQVARVLGGIGTPERDLALVSALLARVEHEPFTSPRLVALRNALLTGGTPPSRRIASLRSLISWLYSEDNLMFRPIAAALLWRPIFAVAIARWHRAYGAAVVAWLAVVGELEALSALATQAYEHPEDPFPDITDVDVRFEAKGLGHPLISEAAAVRNDVALGGEHPHVLIVSGSNMSGKSTLLRAVGVNVVLALAGGTVRAERLRVSPLVIGATLRVDDSLQTGHSRFYTEILRIRAIVERAARGAPVLFLLDEVLHGTNSHDRRIGAEAIVRALVSHGAIGLVTTHDLALAELTSTLGSAAANVHFADRIEHGRMTFDYRMRPGVVTRSNALELMRAIGLEV
jgi:hypothetical protein